MFIIKSNYYLYIENTNNIDLNCFKKSKKFSIIYRNNKISIYPFSNATWIWNITDVDTSNSIINTEMSYQGGYWYLTTTNTDQTQVDYEYLFDDIREDTNYTVTFTLFDTNSRLFDISKNNTGFNYSIQDNSTNNFSHMITVFGN